MTLRRFFASVDGRVVHGRRAGSGAPLLLLHQSPRSSAELEPLIQSLAADWDVIAPDTPGNGLSDALTRETDRLESYADATVHVLDALGVKKCVVYGFHTGAAIGAALTAKYPERVVGALLNGIPAFDAAERADLAANYLPNFSPRWDGSHLTWAWARMREQTIFFPWYRGDAAGRMAFDVPDPETLTQNVIELCRAGAHYRGPYGSAFADAGAELVRQIQVPARVVSTARDPLAPHLDRFTGLPGSVQVSTIEPGNAVICAMLETLRQGPMDAASGHHAIPEHIGYMGSPGAQSCWRRENVDGPLEILIHDLGEDGATALARAPAEDGLGRLAIDLPGHGLSDDGSAEESAERLLQIVTAFDGDFKRLSVRGEGAAFIRPGPAVAPLHQMTPRWSAERLDQERLAFAVPDYSGANLLRLWHRARDTALFDPWFVRKASASIQTANAPDPDAVQGAFLASLVAAPAVRRTLGEPG